jgi:hypothetical protein
MKHTMHKKNVETEKDLYEPVSWNTHAIITRAALSSLEEPVNREIRVRSLPEFLAGAAGELPALIDWYGDLLARKTGIPRKTAKRPAPIETEADFLSMLRLNPHRSFFMVRTLRPDEMSSASPHDHSRYGPPRNVYVNTSENESITVGEVLATFSDEPDWGMDQDLFPIKEYGYGRAPFGIKTGKSSQAIFHMAFLHEPKWFLTLLPGYRQSLMEERIRMALSLAILALDKGCDYWGWRFTAWAAHYLQDLTQPYHASLYPLSKVGIVRRIFADPKLRRLPLQIAMPLQKHHLVFEAAMHFLLNDAVKKRWSEPLLNALSGKGESFEEPIDLVMDKIGRRAARQARTLDRRLVKLLRDPRLDDLTFIPGTTDETMEGVLRDCAQKRPAAFKLFVEAVAACLIQTGRATRYAVKRVKTGKTRIGSKKTTTATS